MNLSVNIVSMLEPQSEVTCHLCYNHVYSFVSCARYMQCAKSSFKNSMCDWLFSWNIVFCIDKFLYGPLLEQVPLKECSTAKRKFSPKTLI